MPAPLARGIIVAASVLVAAGIAAYNENPQFREWVERSRDKVAVAWRSAMDDIRSPHARRQDPSMREDGDEKAKERRRQAREDIIEKGRILEEKRRGKLSDEQVSLARKDEPRFPSFDTLVDDDGRLKSTHNTTDTAVASAVDVDDKAGLLRSRHVDSDLTGNRSASTEAWASQYEQEMRNTWHMPLSIERIDPAVSTHASESILNLTPTTENCPDPDFSVPSISDAEHPLERTDYFSIPPSRSSHERQSQSADNLAASVSRETRPAREPDVAPAPPQDQVSPGTDTAGNQGVPRRYDLDSDDDLSELGDGIRTPASAWTEVSSTVSGVHV